MQRKALSTFFGILMASSPLTAKSESACLSEGLRALSQDESEAFFITKNKINLIQDPNRFCFLAGGLFRSFEKTLESIDNCQEFAQQIERRGAKEAFDRAVSTLQNSSKMTYLICSSSSLGENNVPSAIQKISMSYKAAASILEIFKSEQLPRNRQMQTKPR